MLIDESFRRSRAVAEAALVYKPAFVASQTHLACYKPLRSEQKHCGRADRHTCKVRDGSQGVVEKIGEQKEVQATVRNLIQDRKSAASAGC